MLEDLRASAPPHPRLGEREREVLDVLWDHGSATVQQVTLLLGRSPAYTTVMTTLDRLYKKQLLRRERRERAFVYTAAVTRNDLERGRAKTIVEGFFSRSCVNHDTLVSCLVEAVRSYDSSLILQLEDKIRVAKAEMMQADRCQERAL